MARKVCSRRPESSGQAGTAGRSREDPWVKVALLRSCSDELRVLSTSICVGIIGDKSAYEGQVSHPRLMGIIVFTRSMSVQAVG